MPRAPRRCPGDNYQCPNLIRGSAKYCPAHSKSWTGPRTASSKVTRTTAWRRKTTSPHPRPLPMPRTRPHMHRLRHRGRPHRQHHLRRRRARPRQRPRHLRTLPPRQDTDRSTPRPQPMEAPTRTTPRAAAMTPVDLKHGLMYSNRIQQPARVFPQIAVPYRMPAQSFDGGVGGVTVTSGARATAVGLGADTTDEHTAQEFQYVIRGGGVRIEVNNLDGILRDLLATVLLYTDGSHDDPTRSRLCGPRRNGVAGQRVLRSVKSLKVPAYGGGVPRYKQGT